MNGYYEQLPFKGSHCKTPGGIKLSKEAVPADLCQSLVFFLLNCTSVNTLTPPKQRSYSGVQIKSRKLNGSRRLSVTCLK